jgi:hypothetical protein
MLQYIELKKRKEKKKALPGRKHIGSSLFAFHHHKQSMAPSLVPL